jgi:homoserine kinase
LVTPDVVVPTVEARAVLPKEITLKQMVQQTGAVAQLVDAIYRGDIEAMAYAMQLDTVIEPARQHLMPFMREVRVSAQRAGAMNLVISGAGPTLCSICESKRVAQNVIEAMKQIYDNENIKCMVHATQVCMDGARIL